MLLLGSATDTEGDIEGNVGDAAESAKGETVGSEVGAADGDPVGIDVGIVGKNMGFEGDKIGMAVGCVDGGDVVQTMVELLL